MAHGYLREDDSDALNAIRVIDASSFERFQFSSGELIAPPPDPLNGILPITVEMRKRGDANTTLPQSSTRSAMRLKVVIRKLPVGLKQEEFEAFLGEEWNNGGPKVDWMEYKQGKSPKEQDKPIKHTRVYLHLKDEKFLLQLVQKIRETNFIDELGTHLLWQSNFGPPTLEFSPCARVPNKKPRHDGRQGSIDTEPTFCEFLQDLTTAPAAKATLGEVSQEAIPKKEEKVSMTPLVQFIKDKKSTKAREVILPAKLTRSPRQEHRDVAKEKIAEKNPSGRSEQEKLRPADGRPSRREREKTAKESVKILNREAAGKAPSTIVSSASAQTDAEKPPAPQPVPTAPSRRRERGNFSVAAKILQRDLGLAPNIREQRGIKKDSADNSNATPPKASAKLPPNAPSKPANSPLATAAKAPTSNNTSKIFPRDQKRHNQNRDTPGAPKGNVPPNAPTGPAAPNAILRKPIAANTPPVGPAAFRPQPKLPRNANHLPPQQPQAPSTATQGFIKHANASQGITEENLLEALSAFGTVAKVEVDKKKGFAYVEYESPEGLAAARAAGPFKVASSNLSVLERRDKVPLNAGGNTRSLPGRGEPANMGPRGGGRGRRGGRGNNISGVLRNGRAPSISSTAAAEAVTTQAPEGEVQ
ncbi:MAG: hypothetical protein M1829_004383 [Trizodia sp. TS-e1964]|nr:MAG: hypothetical protein M1829_004383 [Trizodia sp. TS-e1964]